MAFTFLDHTADAGVRITARNAGELVTEAARAFYAILLGEGAAAKVELREERRIDLSGRDGEDVLVAFLNELIYRFDAERLVLPRVEVEEAALGPGAGRLRARLAGERFDPARHPFRTEVKGTTYHGLRIQESAGELTAEVIFDL